MVHANMGNETVLMSLSNGEYYGINDVGSTIWNLLEKQMCLGELIEKLIELYGINTEQCEADISEFISSLTKHGILELSETSE